MKKSSMIDLDEPEFEEDDGLIANNYIREKRKKGKTLKKTIFKIAAVIFVLGFIYIPQIFMKPDAENNTYIIEPDFSKVSYGKNAPQNYPNDDFDGDGIMNVSEISKNINPWLYDTDNDGISDADEIKMDSNPRRYDNTIEKVILDNISSEGKTYSTAYNYNGVILWAKDKKSRIYGGVIQTYCGYQFHDFKGYADFPEEGYAYKYENGKHTLLKYDKKNKRWKIEEDCLVIIYREKLEETNYIKFFGAGGYVKSNGFTNFITKILPDYGFITARNMIKADTEITLDRDTIVPTVNSLIKEVGKERFAGNDIDLEDIALVRKYIESGYSVPVSLFDEEEGEVLAFVKGYTKYGNLIIGDFNTYETIGEIQIIPISRNYLNAEGKIYQRTYYKWKGMGFDSESGDRIKYLYDKF